MNRGEKQQRAVMADMPDFNAKLWSQNLSAVLDRNRDMAACRKLKQDIEQTLKKVADGILLFNEFNKKMEESQVRISEHFCVSSQHADNPGCIQCCTCNETTRLSNHSLPCIITS